MVFGLDIDIDTDPQTLAAEIIIIIIHSAIKKYSYFPIKKSFRYKLGLT